MALQPVAVDQAGFRSALSTFASSVNVITLWDENETPLGMTATAFCSVSAEPLLILVSINRSTRTYDHIVRRGSFGVNILGSVAQDISDYCARAGADKHLHPEWLSTEPSWHNPALAGALAFLDCQLERDITAGTHAIFIGAVKGIGLSPAGDHEPLLYFHGKYRRLRPARTYPAPDPLPVLLEEVDEMV